MSKAGLNNRLSTDGFITGTCPNLYVYRIIRQWEDRTVGVLEYTEENARKYVDGILNFDSPDVIIPTLAGVVGVLFEYETINENYEG